MKKSLSIVALLLSATMLFSACGKTTTPPSESSASEATGTGESAAENTASTFDSSALQIKALDERTLEVKLKARTPYFLELTAFPTYMPVKKDIVEANSDAWATAAETYIGNGAYKITEWVPGSHINMEKNENYWDAANIGPQKLNFSLIEDDVPQYNAFQADELQFIDSVPTAEVATLKSNPEFYVDSQLGTYYVTFNNQAAPFDNPLVRKAFSLAIDRVYMAEVIGEGIWLPADAWVPRGMLDGDKDFREVGGSFIDTANYAANLEEAKAALAEAGYPNGEGLPVIEYIYNEGSIHPQVAEALQNMWGELGATVNVSMQEWATFLNTRKDGNYMTARDGWLNDYKDPVGMLDLFITGSGNNNPQYSNPEYDALISQIKTEADPTARMQLLHQAETTLMENWVFAPILYYADPYMMTPELKDNAWASPLGYKYFMYAKGLEEINICLGPQPDTIDPALNTAADAASYIMHTFDGLYKSNKSGDVEPAIAESVDISEDGLTYTFHLREGVKWSDGSPLTAEDFVYSWTRAINPETAADYGYMFEVIAGYDEAIAAA